MCNVFNVLQVFPVSKKVHTTRCKAQGVITFEDTQLVSFQHCRNDVPEAAGSASQIAKDFLICTSYKINHADVSSSFTTGCRQTDRICFFSFLGHSGHAWPHQSLESQKVSLLLLLQGEMGFC